MGNQWQAAWAGSTGGDAAGATRGTPGKTTLSGSLPARPSEPAPAPAGEPVGPATSAAVQRMLDDALRPDLAAGVHEAAAHGISGGGGALPHLDVIQPLFGHHDVGGVISHQDGAAQEGAQRMGAQAYATGDHVAFAAGPSLHTAAHEAAHVVQQRAGVQLLGGVGAAGDPYERHADAVADAVVRGESAEGLLDQYAGGGGGSGGAVQRVGNEAEPGLFTIFGIHAHAQTPQQKLTALEQSNNQVFWYGQTAKTDEETEITAGASFLERRKADWRAELQHRANQQNAQNPQAPHRQAWESFQLGVDAMTPHENRIQAPWFMNQNFGYQLNNQQHQQQMQQLGQGLQNPTADDPQELLGCSYQRDTQFLDNSPDMAGHHVAVNAQSTANTFNGWNNDVLKVTSGNHELRVRITGVGGFGQAFVVNGTVLASPAVPWGINAGAAVSLTGNGFNGTLQIADTANNNQPLHQVANGWAGRLESWSYYQAMTVQNDALGMHVQGAGAPRARNRGQGANLNDQTFATVGGRYGQQNDPRALRNTLGTQRTHLNFSDVGGTIRVAPYRRLGGDAIFNEAQHQHPGNYQNLLQPAGNVDVNNADWYYDQANNMPNRFVGGRSNSTKLYMGAATMLFHENRLSLDDAKDVLAFVIADMVVSGEHSLPECMTTVTMVAGSSEPWTNTGVNLQQATGTLQTWFKLINANTKNAMYQDARQKLLGLLANPNYDDKLVKVFVILDKMLYNELNP